MDYSTGLCACSIMNLLLFSSTITFFSHRRQATKIYLSTALSEQHKVRKNKGKTTQKKYPWSRSPWRQKQNVTPKLWNRGPCQQNQHPRRDSKHQHV